MNKPIMILSAAVVLVAGLVVGCMIKCGGNKIAVVDIQQIVNSSEQVRLLKEEQIAKAQDLGNWLKNSQQEVDKEKNKEKKEALLKQYSEEFSQKREEVAKQYAQKLKLIDDSITQTIIDTAKDKGYDLVISKAVTVYGGDDITEEIAKVIE